MCVYAPMHIGILVSDKEHLYLLVRAGFTYDIIEALEMFISGLFPFLSS